MYVNPDRYPHFGANNSALNISVHVRDGVVQKNGGQASCFSLDQYGGSIVGAGRESRTDPAPRKVYVSLAQPFFSLFVRFWRDLRFPLR